MLKVGITGGIGSGKTTICKIFETLGIPVYYADQRAKALMHEHPELRQQLADLFGKAVYGADGRLDRQYLAAIVFKDRSKLDQLNALVHPAVARDSLEWHQQQKGVPYTLKEAALLFESGSYRQLDKIITVTAPEHIRIQRVIERDHTTAEAVKARIAQQMPEEEKVAKADFVIWNDGSSSLIKQVLGIHRILKGGN